MSVAERPKSGLSGLSIAALLLASAQSPLGSTMIAVALPSIHRAFGGDLRVLTTLLVTTYLVVNIVSQSPGGRLADLLGHAHTVRIGMVLYAAGAAFGLFAANVASLVVSRAVMALGGAFVVPATLALLRVHVAADRRGRVFGLFGATMGLSAAIGPPLGGELVSRFGFRAIFFASLPFLAGAAVLSRIAPLPAAPPGVTKRSPGDFLRSFDWSGAGLLSLGLGLLVASSKTSGATRLAVLGASLAVGGTFIFWELRSKDPVLDPRLFMRRAFAAGTAVIALQNLAMYGVLFELPQFFSEVRGATSRDVGHVLFVLMLGMFFASPIGGRTSDRFGARTAALGGLVPMAIGFVWLSRLHAMMAPRDAAGALLLLGVGFGLCTAPSQAASMSSVGPERSGMAAGVSSMLRYLGGVLSILVLGAALGGKGSPTASDHEAAFMMFGVALVLAGLACAALPGRSNRERA